MQFVTSISVNAYDTIFVKRMFNKHVLQLGTTWLTILISALGAILIFDEICGCECRTADCVCFPLDHWLCLPDPRVGSPRPHGWGDLGGPRHKRRVLEIIKYFDYRIIFSINFNKNENTGKMNKNKSNKSYHFFRCFFISDLKNDGD